MFARAWLTHCNSKRKKKLGFSPLPITHYPNRSNPLADEFKPGDKVQWNTAQGITTGTVKQKLTSPTDIKGHHVAASEENPEYLVESEKTGKEAAHKPESLKKVEADNG
jgi:Hypervirulence associated proteins TUDOR domain